jgi:hypothetical protein
MKKIKVSEYAKMINKTTTHVYSLIQKKEVKSIIENNVKYIVIENEEEFFDNEKDEIEMMKSEIQLLKKELEMKDIILEEVRKHNDVITQTLSSMSSRIEENNILNKQLQNMLQLKLEEKEKKGIWRLFKK